MGKKNNTITVFYDEVTQRDIYRLDGVDVTDTIEMLKDKWERQILDTRCRLFQLDMSIQQRLQEQIADLEAKLAKSEKERELDNSFWKQECDSLQKQLHDLPKEIVGEIRTHFLYGVDGETTGIDIILDSILEKFGGNKNDKFRICKTL